MAAAAPDYVATAQEKLCKIYGLERTVENVKAVVALNKTAPMKQCREYKEALEFYISTSGPRVGDAEKGILNFVLQVDRLEEAIQKQMEKVWETEEWKRVQFLKNKQGN